MTKRVLSIVIGTEYTKVCEVSYNRNNIKKGIKVYRSISFPTPKNSIEDGFIRNMNAFGEELTIQLRANDFKSNKVIFSVASSKIASREVILPLVNENRIMDIIRTGASEYFPIDIKEYILSYSILEKITSDGNTKDHGDSSMNSNHPNQGERRKIPSLKKKSRTEMIADHLDAWDSGEQTSSKEATTDHKERERRPKKQMRLSVFAVPASLVKNYYQFASKMKFDIVSFDYSGNSSYQIIKRQAKAGTNVFVQLNEHDTLISILRDDVLVLQRSVGYGMSNLVEAVMEEEDFGLRDEAQAYHLMEKYNLLSMEANLTNDFDSTWSQDEAAVARIEAANIDTPDHGKLEARRNVMDSLFFLTNSISRMLDYYRSNHRTELIQGVFLTGTGVKINGIDAFFSSAIGLPNHKMEKLATVTANKRAMEYLDNPSEFISCIGAVINPVDFVPLEFVQKKQRRSAIVASATLVTACILGSLGTIYISYTDYLMAEKELDRVKAELEEIPPLRGDYKDYEEAKLLLDHLNVFANMTQSQNDNIKDITEQLEEVLPSKVIVNSMQFSDTGVTMNVTGYPDNTGASALIAKTLLQVKSIEYFNHVDISGISITDDQGNYSVSFTISCTY